MSNIYIHYGSQTGNGESIASFLKEDIINFHIKGNVFLSSLNNSLDAEYEDVKCIIIICSTTGNGEFPENASRWWRFYKSRLNIKKNFVDKKLILLGLGDSNYNHFCKPIQQIDKRLNELGGIPIMNTYCIDAAVGNDDEMTNEWIGRVISILQQL